MWEENLFKDEFHFFVDIKEALQEKENLCCGRMQSIHANKTGQPPQEHLQHLQTLLYDDVILDHRQSFQREIDGLNARTNRY